MSTNWVIRVAGYGSFLFVGTEEEAEEMRRHKARWERAVAHKRPADAQEVAEQTPSRCDNHPGWGDRHITQSCWCDDESCYANALERREAATAPEVTSG
ncbi:hypothetical protein HEP73_02107 [Xanthomonas sp. GW]|uniref:hypothetical protein n=1 Tax=Xanthomonas sp. GW TaxID=2724121 RepID=UPI00163A1365|nr:hypothetical protein [Xanthomonas sp. GW]QNH21195.1 hypothetical protein HEP73_02107 [Xanthomonas sp. GW]